MVKPEARQVSGEPPQSIIPLMNGNIRGEDFVVSVDPQATSLYVQFEGWIVEYSLEALLEEAYAAVWGNVADPTDIEFGSGGDDDS